jgi:hypothetical protein
MRSRLAPILAIGIIGACRRRPRRRADVAAHVHGRDETAGVRFVHENGASGRKYLPETMGSGGAFLDADGDGWQDILLVNSSSWPGPAEVEGP